MTMRVTRVTRQKTLVRGALARQRTFVSAQALHATLAADDTVISLATVYRVLNDLVSTGDADALLAPTGETLFRGCTTGHHHHLICRRCGVAVELKSDLVEEWARVAARDHGFTDVGHVLDIFGLCADCAVDITIGSDAGGAEAASDSRSDAESN